MSSVLQKYKRQPKLYIDIPSELRFVPESAYEGSFKDVPVYSMSGADELMMRNPEALLNGEATKALIKSCIPSILDPGELSFIDLELLFIAIRIATYGNEYKKPSRCKHCDEENVHSIDLSKLYDHYNKKEYDNIVSVDDLKFYLKPLSTNAWSEIQEKIFVTRRTVFQAQTIGNEDEKKKVESKAFDYLRSLSEESVTSQVVKIVTPEGEETNPTAIKDFLLNEDRSWFDAVRTKLDNNIKDWEIPPIDVPCGSCEKEYSVPLTLDDANFFV